MTTDLEKENFTTGHVRWLDFIIGVQQAPN